MSTANKTGSNWRILLLINLVIVAGLGVLMRYKILFPLPALDQKNLLHAHSHFAFYGWVGQALMVFLSALLSPSVNAGRARLYHTLLVLNAAIAIGMLFSFGYKGYYSISIAFSTAAVLNSYAFAFFFLQDLKKQRSQIWAPWTAASLVFMVLSSLGTFYLAYMMATHTADQHAYLASVYWFLHFQYNGWFFFACTGLALNLCPVAWQRDRLNKAFWLLAGSCLPAYGLSILWFPLSGFAFVLTGCAAFAQIAGWGFLLKSFNSKLFRQSYNQPWQSYILLLIAMAVTLKLLLQLGSLIPSVSTLAFGFRPIVLAYLHLVFLAITSVFLLYYATSVGWLSSAGKSGAGLVLFLVAVYLNEVVLAVQGIASIFYIIVPYVQEILFGVSLIILLSATLLLIRNWKANSSSR